MPRPATGRSTARALACLLAGAGVAHFAVPKPFDALVPRPLPGSPRTWTRLSGLAELGLAAAVALPCTRRQGGLAAAAYFVAVFPANVKMARDWRHRPAPLRVAARARLPLQAPLVGWALRVAGEAAKDPRVGKASRAGRVRRAARRQPRAHTGSGD